MPSLIPSSLVCPSCVMFGKAKQQPVIEPSEAVKLLRESFDRSIKTGSFNILLTEFSLGKLKVESTETVLVDIRQALVACDQTKNRILKEVDVVIGGLIKSLKDRKEELIASIDDYFGKEREKILAEENKWRDRQRVCEDLLKLSSRKDSDQEILLKSKYVADGLEALNERLKFNEVKLINSIDAMMHHKDDSDKQVNISSSELTSLIKGYLQINEFKRLQYKC